MPAKNTPAAPSAKAFYLAMEARCKSLDKGLLDVKYASSNPNVLGQMAQATAKIIIRQNGEPQGLAEVHSALSALHAGSDSNGPLSEEQYARALGRILAKTVNALSSGTMALAFVAEHKDITELLAAYGIELPEPANNPAFLECLWGAARLAAQAKGWAFGKASKAERSGDASAL